MKKAPRLLPTILATTIFFLLFSTSAFSTTYYVKQGAVGTGTSWADASGDLQAMINLAVAGDEIWVAEGTYLPTNDIGGSPSPANPRSKALP